MDVLGDGKRAVLLRNWTKHEAFAAARVERNQLCAAMCLELATGNGTRLRCTASLNVSATKFALRQQPADAAVQTGNKFCNPRH
jgi:hypothetical protein